MEDSSVGEVARLRPERLRSSSSITVRSKRFFFSQMSRPAVGPTHPPING